MNACDVNCVLNMSEHFMVIFEDIAAKLEKKKLGQFFKFQSTL